MMILQVCQRKSWHRLDLSHQFLNVFFDFLFFAFIDEGYFGYVWAVHVLLRLYAETPIVYFVTFPLCAFPLLLVGGFVELHTYLARTPIFSVAKIQRHIFCSHLREPWNFVSKFLQDLFELFYAELTSQRRHEISPHKKREVWRSFLRLLGIPILWVDIATCC